MTDEGPPFSPPRPAMPVRRQEQRVADAEREATPMLQYEKDTQIAKNSAGWSKQAERSLRAKRAWQTRRANATVAHTPDRHRPGLFTAQEAIALARLMVDYPFLRKLVE